MSTLKLNLEYEGKNYEVIQKDAYDIENCEEGKFVSLILKNGEEYNGVFRGMDNEDIMLRSVCLQHTIGFSLRFLKYYFEQT